MEKFFIDQYKANYDLEGAFNPESQENKNLKKNIDEFYKNLEDYVNKYNTAVAAYNKDHKKSTLSECSFEEVKKDIYMHWGSRLQSSWFDQYIHYRITGVIDVEYNDYYNFFKEHGALYIQTQIEKISDEEILAYIKHFMDHRYTECYRDYQDATHENIKKKYLMLYVGLRSSRDRFDCSLTRPTKSTNDCPLIRYQNYKTGYGIYTRFDDTKTRKDARYYEALTYRAKREEFERDETSRLWMEDMVNCVKDAGTYRTEMSFSELSDEYDRIKKKQKYEQMQADIASGKLKVTIFDVMPIWLLRILAAFPARHSWMLLFLLICPFANRGLSGAIFIIVVYGTGSIIGLIANEYLKAREDE